MDEGELPFNQGKHVVTNGNYREKMMNITVSGHTKTFVFFGWITSSLIGHFRIGYFVCKH